MPSHLQHRGASASLCRSMTSTSASDASGSPCWRATSIHTLPPDSGHCSMAVDSVPRLRGASRVIEIPCVSATLVLLDAHRRRRSRVNLKMERETVKTTSEAARSAGPIAPDKRGHAALRCSGSVFKVHAARDTGPDTQRQKGREAAGNIARATAPTSHCLLHRAPCPHLRSLV